MNNLALLLASIVSVASADFSGDTGAVIKNASILSSLVKGWSKDQGLSGALSIQETYEPLSKAVAALASSVDDAVADESAIKSLSDLASGVAGLLSALTEKAADFSSVGADKIVQGDISKLAGPSGDIVSKIYEKGKSNCEAVSSLSGPLSSMNAEFQSAASAFSASAPTFPELKCAGGSDSGSSSSTEAKETGKESSKDSAPASEAKSPTGAVAPANGAAAVGSSAFAMVAALLL